MSNHCDKPAMQDPSLTVEYPDGSTYELKAGPWVLRPTKSGSSASGGIAPRRGRGTLPKRDPLGQTIKQLQFLKGSREPRRGGADDGESSNETGSNASSSNKACNDGESGYGTSSGGESSDRTRSDGESSDGTSNASSSNKACNDGESSDGTSSDGESDGTSRGAIDHKDNSNNRGYM